MTRFESRQVSRRRMRVEAVSPCNRYSVAAGFNPFSGILERLSLALQMQGRSEEDAEKQAAHQVKMQVERKSARARSQRKRNKV